MQFFRQLFTLVFLHAMYEARYSFFLLKSETLLFSSQPKRAAPTGLRCRPSFLKKINSIYKSSQQLMKSIPSSVQMELLAVIRRLLSLKALLKKVVGALYQGRIPERICFHHTTKKILISMRYYREKLSKRSLNYETSLTKSDQRS